MSARPCSRWRFRSLPAAATGCVGEEERLSKLEWLSVEMVLAAVAEGPRCVWVVWPWTSARCEKLDVDRLGIDDIADIAAMPGNGGSPPSDLLAAEGPDAAVLVIRVLW